MIWAIIWAALAGALAYFAIPFGLRVAQLGYDLARYPLKVQQLTRLTVAYRDLCARQPDITGVPEFCQAAVEMVRQLHDDAAEGGYPLNASEVIDAIMLGLADSNTVTPVQLDALEKRICAALPARL